jgi:hypothetical protein
MDIIHLKVQNLGQAFNSRNSFVRAMQFRLLVSKTANLKVENLAQTTFGFSAVRYYTTH